MLKYLSILTLCIIATAAHALPKFNSVTCNDVYSRSGSNEKTLHRLTIKKVKGEWVAITPQAKLKMTNYRFEVFDTASMFQNKGHKWNVEYQGVKGLVYIEHEPGYSPTDDTVRIEVQGTDLDIDGFRCKWGK